MYVSLFRMRYSNECLFRILFDKHKDIIVTITKKCVLASYYYEANNIEQLSINSDDDGFRYL